MVYSFLRSWLIVILLPAVATAAPSTPCRTTSTFLGFSRNDSGYAETLRVTCSPRRGVEDSFELARLFDSNTGKLKAAFRAGFPARLVHGHPVAVSPASWSANYPAWRNALPQRSWSKLADAAHFRRVQHDFDSDAVRFRPIQEGVAQIRHQGPAITLSSTRTPLAFAVVARTKDGQEHDVAVVRGSTNDRVNVRFFFSPDGRHVAVHIAHGNGTAQIVGTSLAFNSPLDTPDIGVLNVMQWEADAALSDYNKVGDGKHDASIDSYIADAFRS